MLLDYDSEYVNIILNHNHETVTLMCYEIRSIAFNGTWPKGDPILPIDKLENIDVDQMRQSLAFCLRLA